MSDIGEKFVKVFKTKNSQNFSNIAGDVSLCLLVSQIIASRTIKINGRTFPPHSTRVAQQLES